MSISFSYFTTTAWEKFVEKHDAFMRNFKTKVKNEKRKKKLCFRLKWWILPEFGIFCSRFTHSCLWPFSFHSFPLPHDFRPPVSDRRGFTGLMAEGSMFNDVVHEAWQRTRSDLSGPHRSLIAFTLPASVEGGCKRIGRIPRVMRSHSR